MSIALDLVTWTVGFLTFFLFIRMSIVLVDFWGTLHDRSDERERMAVHGFDKNFQDFEQRMSRPHARVILTVTMFGTVMAIFLATLWFRVAEPVSPLG